MNQDTPCKQEHVMHWKEERKPQASQESFLAFEHTIFHQWDPSNGFVQLQFNKRPHRNSLCQRDTIANEGNQLIQGEKALCIGIFYKHTSPQNLPKFRSQTHIHLWRSFIRFSKASHRTMSTFMHNTKLWHQGQEKAIKYHLIWTDLQG